MSAVATIIPFIVAYFYDTLGVRRLQWSDEKTQFLQPQIAATMLELVPEDLGVTEAEKKYLAESQISKVLTGVFWEAVDGDEAARAHKEHFYSNGARYTTVIDVSVLSAFASLLYVAARFITHRVEFGVVATLLALLSGVSLFGLLRSLRKQHLVLSRDQLDLLKRTRKQFISDAFREIVIDFRRNRVAENAAEPQLKKV